MDCLDLILREPCRDAGVVTLKLRPVRHNLLLILSIFSHDLSDLIVDLEDRGESGWIGGWNSLEIVEVDVVNRFDGFGQKHVLVLLPPFLSSSDHRIRWLRLGAIAIYGFGQMYEVPSVLGDDSGELRLLEFIQGQCVLDLVRLVEGDECPNGVGGIGHKRIDDLG